MTDIFTYDEDGFRNIALEGDEVSEQGTYRPVSIPSTDVNSDQVTEVPAAVVMPGTSASDAIYMLDWYAYSPGDDPVRVCTTYQNVSENWQFLFPENWRSHVTVSKNTSENMTTTTFYEYVEEGANVPLFTIYRLTGDIAQLLCVPGKHDRTGQDPLGNLYRLHRTRGGWQLVCAE